MCPRKDGSSTPSTRLRRRRARLRELAGDAADLHHRRRRAVDHHGRHLQHDLQLLADRDRREVVEGLGTVARLEQERSAGRDLGRATPAAGAPRRRRRAAASPAAASGPPRRRLRPATRAGARQGGPATRTATRWAATSSRFQSRGRFPDYTRADDSRLRNGALAVAPRARRERARLAQREQPSSSAFQAPVIADNQGASHAHLLRHPADRAEASRQLHRRLPPVRRDAGARRGVLLHRRPALDHGRLRPRGAARRDARPGGDAVRERPRPRRARRSSPRATSRRTPRRPGCSAR